MPLYMDIHSLDGAVTFEDVGKAHQADLQTQGGYDVSYLRYWVDGSHGKIFCLVEAPDPTPQRRFIARRTASSLKRSTKFRRGHEIATHHGRRGRRCRPAGESSGRRIRTASHAVLKWLRLRRSLGHGQVPQPHCRQESGLFDLGRYCRNHLHRRTRDGCHGGALCQRRPGEGPSHRCDASGGAGLCTGCPRSAPAGCR